MTDIGPAFTRCYCKYFDEVTNLCKVYSKRFEKEIDCLSTEEAIKQRALPSDCPYVKGVKGYVGPMSADDLEKIV